MIIFRRLIISLTFVFLAMGTVNAASNVANFYRNFWYPLYHGQRLNYCTLDGKCGVPVANTYCRMMGFDKSNKEIIDYNAGLTNYLQNKAMCKGWDCNSFMLISCVGKMVHKPPQTYYYRSHRFVVPRLAHYRVDWCYENGKGCGKRAAFSFCRRMGYANAQHFTKQEHVPATKALGNQRLCFGPICHAFAEITCYR